MLAMLDAQKLPIIPQPPSHLSISNVEVGKVSMVASWDHVTQFWPMSLKQKFVRVFQKSFCLFLIKGTGLAGMDSSFFYLKYGCDAWS